jgi:pimeloyl-ACP methyl ester carboxylesterase
MMGQGRALIAAVVALGLVGSAAVWSAGQTAAATGEAKETQAEPPGSVILLRGFANVLSRGLDDLGAELRRGGVQVTVENHTAWPWLAENIETRYANDKRALPVVIIGHSLGANAALLMAGRLAKDGIPVALVVTFDAVSEIPVPANVKHAVNFYVPQGMGKELHPGRGFRGKLENIDVAKLNLGIDHFTIEKTEQFHKQVIPEVVRLLQRRHAGG